MPVDVRMASTSSIAALRSFQLALPMREMMSEPPCARGGGKGLEGDGSRYSQEERPS